MPLTRFCIAEHFVQYTFNKLPGHSFPNFLDRGILSLATNNSDHVTKTLLILAQIRVGTVEKSIVDLCILFTVVHRWWHTKSVDTKHPLVFSVLIYALLQFKWGHWILAARKTWSTPHSQTYSSPECVCGLAYGSWMLSREVRYVAIVDE
jgi:hypothetical protein